MGFKDRVKGAFFEDDPGKSKPVVKSTASQPATKVAAPTVSAPLSQAMPVAEAPDQRFLEVLTNTIEGACSPAWKQFVLLLSSLATVIADENTLYKAAFTAAQAQGLTYEQLRTAALGRLELLKQEQQAFEGDLSGKQAQVISQKQLSLEDMDRQMAALQVQLDNLRRQRDALAHDIGESQKRIEHSRQKFSGAQAALRSKLEQDLARIETHLKS